MALICILEILLYIICATGDTTVRIRQLSSSIRHSQQALQSYMVQAVLPAFGVVLTTSKYIPSGTDTLHVVPLTTDTGSYGVHVSARVSLGTIKSGTVLGAGSITLNYTKQCCTIIPAAHQQLLGMYQADICIAAKDSGYAQQLYSLLHTNSSYMASDMRVYSGQLQTSWQGDYSIRDTQSCAGIFVGRSLLVLQGGKFCSIGLSQSNCKLWMQALQLQTSTPNSLYVTQSGSSYSMYTPNARQALGYISSGPVATDAETAQKLSYKTLVQSQQQPVAGLYRVYDIDSAQLNTRVRTVLGLRAQDAPVVTQDTQLSVLRSQWLDHMTGSQIKFSRAHNISLSGTKAPGVIYWEPGTRIAEPDTQSMQKLAKLKKLRQDYPALTACLFEQQIEIPIQYTKAHKQLTAARVLQYKDQQEQVKHIGMIAQLDDGSIILKDGHGSQIRMVGGNIYISAANDIYLEPRNNILMMPGASVACTASSVQLSGMHAVSVISGANIDLVAGAEPAAGAKGQIAGTVNISGADVAVSASNTIYSKASAAVVQGYDMDNGCRIDIHAGKSGITIHAGDIHAKAQNTISGLVGGAGLYVSTSQTVLSGELCTCTGTLRLSRSPILGLESAASHAIFAEAAVFAQCTVYGNLAVKHSIVCNSLGYYISQGQRPKPPNRSSDNYAVSGTFNALDTMQVTAVRVDLPGAAATVSRFPQLTIAMPQGGWHYLSYAYGWQHQLIQSQYHGLRIAQPGSDTYYTFPGRLQDTVFYTVNKDKLQIQKNTLQKFNIRK